MAMPHKCPVCHGKGTVPVGFYDSGETSVTPADRPTCKSCAGTGVVWSAWPHSTPTPRPMLRATWLPGPASSTSKRKEATECRDGFSS